MQWNNRTLSLVQKGQTSECSGFGVYCILHPLVRHFCTKDNVPTTIYYYSTAYCIHCVLCPLCTASTSYRIHHVLYPLCTTSTASTGLTFLHQKQCPHHLTPLFHCIHCILDLLCTASIGLTFLHQIQLSPPPYTTIPPHPLHIMSTVYHMYCVLDPLV